MLAIERYDCPVAVAAMNELYETLRLYLNFFQPTFKLQQKKQRVKTTDGAQYGRYIMSDVPYKQNDSFGKRVRKLRRSLDMLQEELANKINTSRSYISALEHDEYEPKLDTMKKVAKAFSVNLDELVKGL